MLNYDAIVVGAGFAGSVIAERLATQKSMKVLLIEKEKHIAGHCFDYVNEDGLIIHKYGPHLFHTNNLHVWEYLSQFTNWNFYEHKVLAHIDGKNVPLPFSFETIELLFPDNIARRIEKKLINRFSYNSKITISELLTESDEDMQFIAKYIYEKVFVNYTIKQWGLTLEQIDDSVSARVPIIIGYDTRYFTDIYQAVPQYGYTKLFEKILSHKNIHLLLGINFSEIAKIKNNEIHIFNKKCSIPVYYSGMIDELFGFCIGELPYRSLKLDFQVLDKEKFQEAATINYPNNYTFTRITEFKQIHYNTSRKTTILVEYPQNYTKDFNKPYYPIFTEATKNQYEKYFTLANKIPNLRLIGRLAEYKYYNMDDIVKKALELYE
jgi:UDP-galactopyranose mutase